jgi:serine protease Do
MAFYRDFSAVFASVAISSALVITIPQPVRAMTGTEVNEIAREVTVLIVSQQGQGSGVIIAREGNQYSVLTNQHVVSEQTDYGIVTADRQTHKISSGSVRSLPDVDLAPVTLNMEWLV